MKHKIVSVLPSNLYEASEELSAMLVKLYRKKIFVRSGKEFADMLFTRGMEAGALLSGITSLTERKIKIATANKAILKFSQTLYILKTMKLAGFYSSEDIAEIKNYIGEIIKGLKDMLINAPEITEKDGKKQPSPVYQLVVRADASTIVNDASQNAPAEQKAAENAEADKAAPEQISYYDEEDDDGFNDYVDYPEDLLPIAAETAATEDK